MWLVDDDHHEEVSESGSNRLSPELIQYNRIFVKTSAPADHDVRREDELLFVTHCFHPGTHHLESISKQTRFIISRFFNFLSDASSSSTFNFTVYIRCQSLSSSINLWCSVRSREKWIIHSILPLDWKHYNTHRVHGVTQGRRHHLKIWSLFFCSLVLRMTRFSLFHTSKVITPFVVQLLTTHTAESIFLHHFMLFSDLHSLSHPFISLSLFFHLSFRPLKTLKNGSLIMRLSDDDDDAANIFLSFLLSFH